MTDALITLSIGRGLILIIIPIILIGLVLMYIMMRKMRWCRHEGICSYCIGRNSQERSEEGRI